MPSNLILDTDSYKASHWLQYPPGTSAMYSYLESRGGTYGQVVFFGLQYLLEEYLAGSVVRPEDVAEAEAFFTAHGEPFNSAGWLRIAGALEGRLPVRIRAVPEGSVVPVRNALMSVESTDPETFWVVSWLEAMLVRLWYPITVATLSRHVKQVILEALRESADDPFAELPFKLHDFGSRGVSSRESAGIGGMAHLVNFQGSDTVEGVRFANRYYGAEMAAFSIPAAEHSTITAWGRGGELAAYRNMVKQFCRPGKIVACVSDSYDVFNAVERFWAEELADDVEQSGATLVIRPDSGDPVQVVVACLEILERKVGMTRNRRGYKVLPRWFRLIQGDGVNPDSIAAILREMLLRKYSASNIAFGMGGGLLQQVNRDTQKFAFKCSEVTVDGAPVKVFKDPVTDAGKRSKAGRLSLLEENGKYLTVEGDVPGSLLEPVFENGRILRRTKLAEVRERAERGLR
ncbi:MAG TPA: nicotinate phosphoribosyltransferase [Myxococcales bacterium]|nr:nicotinate phosphoribosyltransferase [Myxococcales bacterium]